MLFMLQERILNKEVIPLVSCRDIHDLLRHFLTQEQVTDDEIISLMEKRHKKRQASIDSAYKLQKL